LAASVIRDGCALRVYGARGNSPACSRGGWDKAASPFCESSTLPGFGDDLRTIKTRGLELELDHLFGALNPARILGLGSATGRDLISITIGSSRLLISRLSWPGSSRSVLYVFKLVWQRARHPRQSAPSSSTPALHRRPVLRRSERKDLSTCMIYMLYARTTFYSASSHVTAACSRAAPPGPDTLHGWPGHEGDAI
jgi:hypothetical protein